MSDRAPNGAGSEPPTDMGFKRYYQCLTCRVVFEGIRQCAKHTCAPGTLANACVGFQRVPAPRTAPVPETPK